MDVNLPAPRSVFLPQVPEQLNAFKDAIEVALAHSWDNVDAVRSALGSVTSGTVSGMVVVTASATHGSLIYYVTSGTDAYYDVLPAGGDGQLLTWSSGSPVFVTASGPLDVSPATAGALIISTAGAWATYAPGTVGSVLTINASTMPAWAMPAVGDNGNVVYRFYGADANDAYMGYRVSSASTAAFPHFFCSLGNTGVMLTANFYKAAAMGTNALYSFRAKARDDATSSHDIFIYMATAMLKTFRVTAAAWTFYTGSFNVATVPNETWNNLTIMASSPLLGTDILISQIVILITS